MNLLVALALALLVIHSGVKLLIQAKKEAMTPLYRYVSWFIILGGFLIIACAGAFCIAKCCRYGSHMMTKNHAHHCTRGGDMDGDEWRMHKKWMKHGMMNNCQMHGNSMAGGSCSMMSCPMMNHEGCGMNKGSCGMENMGMMCKPDSFMMKKEERKR